MAGVARASSGPDVDELDVAVRAWAIRADREGEDESPGSRRGGGRRFPDQFLVFDTESTITSEQRLLFGCWRYYRTRTRPDGQIELVWVAEGLFHPDDLATRDPEGHAILYSFDGELL